MGERLTNRIVFLVFAAASVAFIWASWGDPEVSQPAAFPPAGHVALRTSCGSCHNGAFDEARARIPSTQICALCHRAGRSFPPTSLQLAAFINARQEIPWNQAQRLPRHVYFSHRRHVTAAGIDCAACHGNVGAKIEPVTRGFFSRGEAGMMQCVECHRREKVTTDCLGCHH